MSAMSDLLSPFPGESQAPGCPVFSISGAGSTPLFPAAAVDFFSVSRIDKPCPTSPATTSLMPSVPLRMVRFYPAIPWAAACTIDGRASMMRLAAMSSWLPSLSEPALALLASACASAVVRSAYAVPSAWIFTA